MSRHISQGCHPAILLATTDLSCEREVKDLTCRRFAGDEMMVPNSPRGHWMPAAPQQQAMGFSLMWTTWVSLSDEVRIAGRIT